MIYNFCFQSLDSKITRIIKETGGKKRPHFDCLLDSFFSPHKQLSLNILILGEKDPNNVLVWLTYFPNSEIYMENDYYTTTFDLIVVEKPTPIGDFPVLNPGGILIAYNTIEYEVPKEFSIIRFNLSHDKSEEKAQVFWAQKPGPDIFPSPNKLTIITPSCRPGNINKMKTNMNFSKIYKWIIIFDRTKVHPRSEKIIPPHPQIIKGTVFLKGNYGNPQRNVALDSIAKDPNVSFLYFLDDDNLIHPDLFSILPFLKRDTIYSFNQVGRSKTLMDLFEDTANYIVDFPFVRSHRWENTNSLYIENIYKENSSKCVFIDNEISYYKYLSI